MIAEKYEDKSFEISAHNYLKQNANGINEGYPFVKSLNLSPTQKAIAQAKQAKSILSLL